MQLGHDFIEALNTLAEERELDVDVIISTLESALLSAYKKYQPGNQEAEIRIDKLTGEISVNELRKVVEEVEDPELEISLNDARRFNRTLEIGDTLKIPRDPKNFGRIAEERKAAYSEFADKVGDMVTGTVYKPDGDNIIVHISDKTDAVLPKKEKIQDERYTPGSVMKFYILEVKQNARGPKIMLSRTHPGLLRRLMELEIPEIQQGTIEIKNIVRDGGARAKVSLVTLDPNVDPVGACVGNGGARIKAISGALKGEKVDIVIYSNDPLVYIKNALSPAQIARVEPVLDNERAATVYVYQDQLSLAIGKSGQNVRLAAKLTGWKIDITPVEPDRMPTLKDIFHDVFSDK